MVRTENIMIPAMFHALVNFAFSAKELNAVVKKVSEVNEAVGINWGSVIPTTALFAFIMAGGVYMILNANEKDIMQKLETEVG